MDLFSFSELWNVAGPFLIGAVAAVIIALVGAIIMTMTPKGFLRELVRIGMVASIILGSGGSIWFAAGIWGWK